MQDKEDANQEDGHNRFEGSIFHTVSNVGAAIAALACFALLGMTIGVNWPILPWLLIVGYPLGISLVVISEVGVSGVGWNPAKWIALFVLYSLLAFWDLLSIFLLVPFLVIDLLSGPFAIVGLIVSLILLGDHISDRINGYTLRDGSTALALIALSVSIVTSLLLLWRFKGNEDTIMDKGADFIRACRLKICLAIEKCK